MVAGHQQVQERQQQCNGGNPHEHTTGSASQVQHHPPETTNASYGRTRTKTLISLQNMDDVKAHLLSHNMFRIFSEMTNFIIARFVSVYLVMK